MSTTAATIQEARAFLADTQVEIKKLQHDPTVTQWQTVNFELHGDLLPVLNLPAGLKKLYSQVVEQTQMIYGDVAKWENEIANLDIDIRHNAIALQPAAAWALEITKGCLKLEETVRNIRTQANQLNEADQHLRALLNMEGLLSLTKAFAGKKSRLIDEGFQVFCSLSDDNISKCTGLTIHDYRSKAVAMQKQLLAIDVVALPSLAADIVAFHVGTAMAGTDQIKQFVENADASLKGEFMDLEQLQKKVAALREAPVEMILAAIKDTAKSLGNIMFRFRAHAKLLEKTDQIVALLQNLRIFHDSIKNSLLAAMLQAIQDKTSPLHTGKLAQERAAEYFMGLSGVIRMVKILLKNLTGGANLNEERLAQNIEQALASCTFYGANKNNTINKMQEFIASNLSGYPRPFPYDGLFKIMRLTISEYSDRLEKFFATFPTQSNTAETNNVDATGGPANLGKLLSRIEFRVEILKGI